MAGRDSRRELNPVAKVLHQLQPALAVCRGMSQFGRSHPLLVRHQFVGLLQGCGVNGMFWEVVVYNYKTVPVVIIGTGLTGHETLCCR